MIDQILPKLLTETEAAACLGVEPATLAVWRCKKRYALPYVKVGRLVRYLETDIAAFVAKRTQAGGGLKCDGDLQ